jgi:hypothetical protein
MSIFLHGRWEQWHPQPRQHPTDALHNWAATVGAKVDWNETSARQPDNRVVHTVVPYRKFASAFVFLVATAHVYVKVSCDKCHPLRDFNGNTVAFSYFSQSQAEAVSEDFVRKWAADNNNIYSLLGYRYSVGHDRQVSIMSK